MNKLNNTFIKTYYESFSFILNKSFADKEEYVSMYFTGWVFLDSYRQLFTMKKMFKALKKIFEESRKKNQKILFIIDDDLFDFFSPILKKKFFYYTHNMKIALTFLQDLNLSQTVSAIIVIGKKNDFISKTLTQSNCPVFIFSPKTFSKNFFISYFSLTFQSSLFFLRSLIAEILD